MTLLPVLLPEDYESKVTVNDKLAVGQTIAEKKTTSENIINIAFYFDVSALDIHKFLKKNLGDAVLEGEVLAEKTAGFGKASKKLISQFSGTITKIDKTNGDISIRSSLEKGSFQNIISPVAGTVDFCNNEKIVIKTDQDTILAVDGLGEGAEGELFYIEKVEETSLGNKTQGKILLTGVIDKVSLFKAIGLDAIGIIVKSLEDTDFMELTGKYIKTPVMIVNEEDYKKIVKADKKRIYIGGKDKTIVIL
jgi:hypothetical protein